MPQAKRKLLEQLRSTPQRAVEMTDEENPQLQKPGIFFVLGKRQKTTALSAFPPPQLLLHPRRT